MFEIEFYKKADGKCPVEDFLISLDARMRAKALRAIKLLADFGNALREPDSKPIGDEIFELRAKLGTDIVRILYFFCEGQAVVLTNGFMKKTQKTPDNQIRQARIYRADYLERRKQNG